MSQYKFATIQVAMLQYKSMKTLEINANLAEIESRLNRYSYLSRKTLPGSPDGRVFAILESNKRYPDRKINPNFYHWYILMKQFSRPTIGKWVSDQLYHDQEDNLINEFVQFYATKKDSAPEPTAPAASDPRNNKLNDSTQIQYTIDIALKAYHPDKITSLRRLLLLYRAEMTEDGSNNSKYIRILCRIGPANLEELSRKLNNCIEFSELSLKRKDMKGQKLSQGRELIQ